MLYTRENIESLERIFRLNLINSVTGIKPANLIATRSTGGQENVAIFSSVIHLGSNPALIGFVMRPQTENISDTFRNINETGFYTINHVSETFIKNAHYTSAKLEKEISEFERMKLEQEYLPDFTVPFVKESFVKIGMKHSKSIPLPNDCIFIIGSVELLILPDGLADEEGQLDLERYSCAGISGLNTYYSLQKLQSFPYVGTKEIPEF